MANQNSFDQKKLTIDQKEAIEERAAIAVAETDLRFGANIALNNSFDQANQSGATEDIPSFLRNTSALRK